MSVGENGETMGGIDAVRAALEASVPYVPDAEPDDAGGDDGFMDDGEADSVDVGRDEPVSADPAIVAACSLLDQNDTDNAARLLKHFGDELLFVREIGWHGWTGSHWRMEDGEHLAELRAQETARRIKLEAHALHPSPNDGALIARGEALAGKPDLSDEDKATLRLAAEAETRLAKRRKSRRDFGVSSGNRARTTSMLAQAKPRCAVAPAEIDAHPYRFNVANGTLVFTRTVTETEDPDAGGEMPVIKRVIKATVRLEPHAQADRIAKICHLAHEPAARCDRWADFLERFQPDPAQRRFLQVASGAGMLGGAKTQALIFLYGEGQNGKSVFMETLAQAFGDYAGRLKPESIAGLDTARGDQATPDFARLQGKRIVAIAELPRGAPLKEGLVKTMTGGEPMPVRHLNHGFFDLVPEFIPFMSGNQLPEIGGLDKGIWRRMKFVHWPVQVSEAERRDMPEVVAGFLAEGSGLLNWLVQGALMFLEEGLRDPPAVTALTEQHRQDLDPVGAFIRECVRPQTGSDIQARLLHHSFKRFCAGNAIRPWSEKAFSLAMKQKGFTRIDGRVRVWSDIAVDLDGLPELHETREPD
jgi:putative DNA primase/helicase